MKQKGFEYESTQLLTERDAYEWVKTILEVII